MSGFKVGEVRTEDLTIIITEKSLRDAIPKHDKIAEFEPLPVKCGWNYAEAGAVVMSHQQDITALYLHSAPSSVSHEPKCETCKKAKKMWFAECRTNPRVQNGACSNCVIKHQAAYCTFGKSSYAPVESY
jgi:hypothetical protein